MYCEDADAGAYVDHEVGVGVGEVEALLLAALAVHGLGPVVTLVLRQVTVNVVDALYQTVQLIKLTQQQIHMLEDIE